METNTTETQDTAPKADVAEKNEPENETAANKTATDQAIDDADKKASAEEAKSSEATATEEPETETVEGSTEETTGEATEEEEAEPIEPPMLKIGKEDVPLATILESLLFVAEVGIKPSQFAQALECPVEDIHVALKLLGDSYKDDGRGLRVQERAGRFTMVTTPIAAKSIEAFLELDLTTKLSGPALEALSVIAYRQPVTRPQIESVRGVDCGGVIKTLLQHEMIEEVGRLDAPGRPILYGITDFFMQHFGLTELQDLPPLETTEADMLWAATQIAEGEAGDTAEGNEEEATETVEASGSNAVEATTEQGEQPESDTVEATTKQGEQPESDTVEATTEEAEQPESDTVEEATEEGEPARIRYGG